jgi:hypothetical protein
VNARRCPIYWRGIVVGTIVGNLIAHLVLIPLLHRLLAGG